MCNSTTMRLFKSKSLQKECANLAGGPGSDPKAAAARAQGREPGEMNESSAFNPNNKAKQGSSGMFYRGPKLVAGVNRNPVKKLGMFKINKQQVIINTSIKNKTWHIHRTK